MKKMKKILILACCALLLVFISVGATFAYLTSTPGAVTNTFTAGSVEITLNETKVNEYGEAETGAAPVMANKYKLVPGRTYTKDPTIHVTAGSEPVWLFVKVENGISGIEKKDDTTKPTIEKQLTTNGWKPLIDAEGATVADVYYHDVVDASTAEKDIKVFDTFTVSETADVSVYKTNGATVKVTAYAVQSYGFDDAAAAWEGASFN